jgi:hypothetical protein
VLLADAIGLALVGNRRAGWPTQRPIETFGTRDDAG